MNSSNVFIVTNNGYVGNNDSFKFDLETSKNKTPEDIIEVLKREYETKLKYKDLEIKVLKQKIDDLESDIQDIYNQQ